MLALLSVSIEDPNDREFMTQFYLQYERLMYATVLKRLPDQEAAKDIVQDCVIKLIPRIPFLRRQERCVNASYVVSTVRNTTINYMRKQGRTDGRCCSLEEQDEQDMVMPGPSLDERIILEEQKDRLMQIWSNLPDEDQLLLEGKYILGYKDAELADMLGCKKDSIRMKLTRARRRAFQLMTEEEGDRVCPGVKNCRRPMRTPCLPF